MRRATRSKRINMRAKSRAVSFYSLHIAVSLNRMPMIPRLSRDHEVRKLITNAPQTHSTFHPPNEALSIAAMRFCDRSHSPLLFNGRRQFEQILNHLPGDVAVAMMPARLRGRPCDNSALF